MIRSLSKLSYLKLTYLLLAVVIASFTGAPASAQSAAAAAAAAPATVAAGPILLAKIASKFNTKNAKAGDIISAKVIRAGKLPDGSDVPKGSVVEGTVTTVKSKKDGNGNSLLMMRFDHISLKGGAPVAIKGTLVAIGPSMAAHQALGAGSVMQRNMDGTGGAVAGEGASASMGTNPNAGLGAAGAKDEDNIRLGSTMEGVGLGKHLDKDWTTVLQGYKTDIDLDSDVLIKVQLQ